MKKILFCLLFYLPACAGTAGIPPAPPWSEEVLTSEGIGMPSREDVDPGQAKLLAKRASKIRTLNLLWEQIKGLRVDDSTTVADYLKGELKGYRIESLRYREDGSCITKISIPLRIIWEEVNKVYLQVDSEKQKNKVDK